MIVSMISAIALAVSAPAFTLMSSTFTEGATLPFSAVYNSLGCTGKNVQPELHWSGVPTGTKSLALTIYDPDAPVAGGFWHWVVFNIPPNLGGFSAGENPTTPPIVNGVTGVGSHSYVGPCPPPGNPHHYVFTLYALDEASVPGASASTTGPQLGKAIVGHVLGKATLTGLYGR